MTPRTQYHPGSVTCVSRTGATSTTAVNAATEILTCTNCLVDGDFTTPTDFSYRSDRRRSFIGERKTFYPVANPVPAQVCTGVVGNDVNLFSLWDRDAVWNAGLGRLNEGARNTADWAEDIAQAHTTRKMFSLIDNAADLASKGVGFKRKLVSGVSSLFLQFKYGWQPLLGNIFDTASTQYNDVLNGNICLRYGATIPIELSRPVLNSSFGTGSLKLVDQVTTGKQGVRFKVYIKGEPGNSLADFTTLNPYYLAWNLIPYSFVVDWFYNVGGYLEAAEKALKFSPMFHSGYVTELYSARTVETMNNKKWRQSGPTDYYVSYARASRTLVEFKRTRLHNWPLPNNPSLEIDLGSGRLFAAAALLGTLLQGDKSPVRAPRRILKPSDLLWLKKKALKVR